jgi:hypothetical protein
MKLTNNSTIEIRNKEKGIAWEPNFERRLKRTLEGLPLEADFRKPNGILIVDYPNENRRTIEISPKTGSCSYRGLQRLSRFRHSSSYNEAKNTPNSPQPYIGIYDKRTQFLVCLHTEPLRK